MAAAQATDPTPGVSDWVEGTYTVTLTTITELDVVVDLSINKVTTDGRTLSADGIRDRVRQIEAAGGASAKDAFIKGLEDDLAGRVEKTLELAFPKASSRTVKSTTLDRATLTPTSDTAPYDPPVTVQILVEIIRDPAKIGIGDLKPAAVDAAFEAGAVFSTEIYPAADPGFNATFRILAPPKLGWKSADQGTISADSRTLSVTLSNWESKTLLQGTIPVQLANPTVTPPTEEIIATLVDLDIPSFSLAGGNLGIEATISAAVQSVDATARFGDAIPEAVDLKFVSADGLRGLRNAGVVTDAHLATAEADLLENVRTALAGPLGDGVTVAGQFDAATLAPTATDGSPVIFGATAQGSYKLADVEGDNLDVIFQAGGSVEVALTLSSDPGRSTEFRLTVPSNVNVAEPSAGGSVSANGRTASWVVDNTAGTAKKDMPVTVRIHDANAAVYTAQLAALDIIVDLKDIDITLSGAAGGDLGNLLIDVTVTGNLNVIEVPEELKGEIPDALTLKYLSSDAIRALLRDGVVSQAQIDEMEKGLLDEMQAQIAGALGVNAQVTGGFDKSTLAASLISTPLSGDKPIVFKASLSAKRPLSGDAPPQAQAAIALYSVEQAFDLPKVESLATVYTVILPKGLAVEDATADGGDVEKGTWTDGRDYFRVTPTGDGPAKTKVQMAVTPGFVTDKFLGVVLLAVLLIVLIVGVPIGLVARKMMKKKSA